MAINVDGDSNDAVEIGYGGTGSQLTDPGADRILFWDDSAAAGSNTTWLIPGNGLSITASTLNVTWPVAFTSDYSSDFDAAVVAIGATPTTLYVDDATAMSTNVATPTTLTTIVLKGGSIDQATNTLTTNGQLIMQGGTIDNDATLTINGAYTAGPYQTFTNTSSVVFGKNSVPFIYGEWYGALGDGSTDDYAAFRAAYDTALNSGGGTIQFLGKRYVIDSTIEIGLAGSLAIPVTFQGEIGYSDGSGEGGTILQMDAITTGNALFEQNQGAYVYNHIFRDFAISGAVSGSEVVGDGDAFRLAYINNFHFSDLYITATTVGVRSVDQDMDRVSFKRCKFAGNGRDVVFEALTKTYQVHFEDCEFVYTKEGASIQTIALSNLKYTRFENCSWVACEYQAVLIENTSQIFGMVFEMAYSEQNCHTSGDYAFDFLSSIRGLAIQNSTINEISPAEACMRITTARSVRLIGNAIGNNGVVRALDLGNGTGDIYNPILIGNNFFPDVAGNYITVLGTSTLRNMVSISNIPDTSTMSLPSVLTVSNYYVDSLIGVTFVPRLNGPSNMAGHETFTPYDGMIFDRDAGGSVRNFNPSGTFTKGHMIYFYNSGGETITFDSAGIATDVATGENGIFYYNGTIWRAFIVGSP